MMKLKLAGSNRLMFPIFLLATVILLATLKFVFRFDPHQIIEVFVNLSAVFLGAYFAFAFSANREKQLKNEHDAVNANLALFNLIEYYNSLQNYRIKIIEPERNKPLRLISMAPYLLEDSTSQKIEVSSLSFMLLTSANANLLGRIVVEEKVLRSLSSNIKERTKLHTENIQPKMAAIGLKEGEPLRLDDIRTVVGDRDFCVLRDITDEIIESVDTSIANLIVIIDDMHNACKKMFSGYTFVKLANPQN